MYKFKEKTAKIKQVLSNNDAELIALAGVLSLIYASFSVNKILGFYVMGALLLALAVILIKYPKN